MARLPASTKRSLSLASLPDSCSCCNMAMLRIQSVSRKIFHITLFIRPINLSCLVHFLKACFVFLLINFLGSSAFMPQRLRQIRVVLFEEFSELQKKLPQFESVSPPVTDCCHQCHLITIVSPSLPITCFAQADNQLFLCLLSGGGWAGQLREMLCL